MRKVKTRISIGRISNNPSVRFINAEINKNRSEDKGKALEILAVKCSELSDNKTTYVQKKKWSVEKNNFIFPPYVDCGYVE